MALRYNGVNLSSPDPVVMKPYTGGGDISSLIQLAQSGQNQANRANEKRYGQGLGVLTSGYGQGADFIKNALKDISGVGAAQLENIAQQEREGQANVQQNAIGRGLGNTTIMDTLSAIPTRTANLARLSLADQQAQARSAIRMAQANQANQGANNISGFIERRNDVAPSIGEMAGIIQAASQSQSATPTGKRVSTVTKGSLSTPSWMQPGGGIQTGGGGGALGSNTAITGGGGSIGGGLPYIPNETGGGGGGGGNLPPQNNIPTPQPPQIPQPPNTPNTPQPPEIPQPPNTPNMPPPNIPKGTIEISPYTTSWPGACSRSDIGKITKMLHGCPGYV